MLSKLVPSQKMCLLMSGLGVAASLLLVACGGGGNEATGADLPKAAFVKKADAICEKVNQDQENALQAFARKSSGGPTTRAQKEEFLQAVGVRPVEAEITQLKELGVPDDGGEAEEFISALEEALELVREDPVKATNAASNPFTRVSELGENYGFKVCAPAP